MEYNGNAVKKTCSGLPLSSSARPFPDSTLNAITNNKRHVTRPHQTAAPYVVTTGGIPRFLLSKIICKVGQHVLSTTPAAQRWRCLYISAERPVQSVQSVYTGDSTVVVVPSPAARANCHSSSITQQIAVESGTPLAVGQG